MFSILHTKSPNSGGFLSFLDLESERKQSYELFNLHQVNSSLFLVWYSSYKISLPNFICSIEVHF